ncbi:TonB-dependent receptor [Aliiglaciecola sp. 2_MG-2023]|uniref:TonB-dependent receptor n=1 Tax=unclassified Aliiglaciecola TaxID=2593648 RepID=UPI0026E1869D|nr:MULTISPECIES: TonB-dependent receptor [unclassified Aliiglaciecola]MDO6711566.1 TonB-dependent receptor [Aliiglaciecola sp. 2_MG-2023]MDO6752637.1 TonB-dependent receptor [Aliiglaciecola sp. 1_MG-2023]
MAPSLKSKTLVAIAVATCLSPMSLYAQSNATGANDAEVERVLVTSRKRSEDMNDVPISINVVTDELIDNLGAADFTDLLGVVPSLTSYQNGPGRTRLSIRGVANGGGNDNDTQNQETVGIYMDEIPISMGGMNPEFALFDLKRVEVLRGPQGTLFGAGSMTGTVRLVSNEPDLNEFGGRYEATASSISHGSQNYSVKGLINAPVIENQLAIRASGYYMDNGGYIDNEVTGEKDLNDGISKGAKISTLYFPTDNLRAELTLLHHNYSDNGYPQDIDSTPFLTRNYTSFDGFDDEVNIANLTLKYDLEWAELVSSTSYFDRSIINRRSLDLLFESALPPEVTPHELIDFTDSEVWVQELRLASTTDDKLQWTVGAYADKKDVFYENTFPVPGADAILGVPSSAFGAPEDHLYYGFDDLTVETYALFGEAYYDIGDLSITAGLRYFNWKQNIEFYQSGLFNGESNGDIRPESTTDGVNPKLNVSYRLNDEVLVYAQAAKGFRYGGINGAIPESVCSEELAQVEREGGDTRFFKPDEIWNYEAGIKGVSSDGMFSYNATVFHIDWSDMQTSRSFECGFGFRENVGEATSQGIEFELSMKPVNALTLSLGGAYINSTLDADVPNLSALKGDSAPFVPETTFNASADYERALSQNYMGFAYFNVQYTGDRATEFNEEAANYRKMDAYTVANLRLGVRFDEFEVSLFANNLFDDDGVVRAIGRPPFDQPATIRVTPRTVGLTFRGNY